MFDTLYKKIGLVTLLIIATYIFIDYAGDVIGLLLPLIVALFISYRLRPLIHTIENRLLLPKTLVSLMAVIISVAITSLLGYGLSQLLILLGTQLANVLPNATKELHTFYQVTLDTYHTYFRLIPEGWQGIAANGLDSLLQQIGAVAGNIAASIVNSLTFLPNILFFLVFTLLTTYFITRDFEIIDKHLQKFKDFLHEKPIYHEIKKDVFMVLVGYLKAQLILMTITFVISLIGLTLLKVNYAPLIALAVALIDALPMLGPAVVYVPWIIARAIIGNYTGAISLFILYGITTLTRQMLEPKIVSTQIGIHPIVTLSAMYAGIRLFGVLGILLGPSVRLPFSNATKY